MNFAPEKDVTKKLCQWFSRNHAELPWRLEDIHSKRDPYAVWISETMLQQTQVSAVVEHYLRWMKRFPNVETLAKASQDEVFLFWQGLGYYSRAKNILRTANILVEKYRGKFPENRKELEALPGIGAYTAGAILSLAFHQKESILDGNLVRIFSRLHMLEFLPTDKGGAEAYWEIARAWSSDAKAYIHNEALMELGRTVCKIKNPCCEKCPLSSACNSNAKNAQALFPPSKKHLQKEWHGVLLIIESSDGKILASQSNQSIFLKNQWTFPHFEASRNRTAGVPAEAEDFINPDMVLDVQDLGSFRHSITVHKIQCEVLHILLKCKAPGAINVAKTANKTPEVRWVSKQDAEKFFASSFCLKALKFLEG